MKLELVTYIGDGVYVIFDGYGFWLHANDRDHPTDKVYLEPEVLNQLIEFAKRCGYEQEGKYDQNRPNNQINL